MKSWVLFEPELITTTDDRDPSSVITKFREWSSKIRDLGNYEVKFYLTRAGFQTSRDDSPVFVVNARWPIDRRSPTTIDKASSAGAGFMLYAGDVSTFGLTTIATTTDAISADQGPFYLVHLGTVPMNVAVRVAVRKIRSA